MTIISESKGMKAPRGSKTKAPSEHYEQCLFVQWMRRTYPDARIFAIPNGGARSLSVGAELKAEGVSRGVPDLFVPSWRLFIEMKRSDSGNMSGYQRDWKKYLEEHKYTVFVCHGFEEAKRRVEEWLI